MISLSVGPQQNREKKFAGQTNAKSWSGIDLYVGRCSNLRLNVIRNNQISGSVQVLQKLSLTTHLTELSHSLNAYCSCLMSTAKSIFNDSLFDGNLV